MQVRVHIFLCIYRMMHTNNILPLGWLSMFLKLQVNHNISVEPHVIFQSYGLTLLYMVHRRLSQTCMQYPIAQNSEAFIIGCKYSTWMQWILMWITAENVKI